MERALVQIEVGGRRWRDEGQEWVLLFVGGGPFAAQGCSLPACPPAHVACADPPPLSPATLVCLPQLEAKQRRLTEVANAAQRQADEAMAQLAEANARYKDVLEQLAAARFSGTKSDEVSQPASPPLHLLLPLSLAPRTCHPPLWWDLWLG